MKLYMLSVFLQVFCRINSIIKRYIRQYLIINMTNEKQVQYGRQLDRENVTLM